MKQGDYTHIGDTVDASAFELTAIKLLNCSPQVGRSLKLNEAGIISDGEHQLEEMKLTLCHRDRDQSPNIPRQDWTDGQNL